MANFMLNLFFESFMMNCIAEEENLNSDSLCFHLLSAGIIGVCCLDHILCLICSSFIGIYLSDTLMLYYFYIIFISSCLYVMCNKGCMPAMAFMWRPEDDFQKFVLFGFCR